MCRDELGGGPRKGVLGVLASFFFPFVGKLLLSSGWAPDSVSSEMQTLSCVLQRIETHTAFQFSLLLAGDRTCSSHVES